MHRPSWATIKIAQIEVLDVGSAVLGPVAFYSSRRMHIPTPLWNQAGL